MKIYIYHPILVITHVSNNELSRIDDVSTSQNSKHIQSLEIIHIFNIFIHTIIHVNLHTCKDKNTY